MIDLFCNVLFDASEISLFIVLELSKYSFIFSFLTFNAIFQINVMHPETLERGGKRSNSETEPDTVLKKIKVGPPSLQFTGVTQILKEL